MCAARLGSRGRHLEAAAWLDGFLNRNATVLLSLAQVIPAKTKDTARLVVRKVVDALMAKLEEPMRSAVTGALDRSQRNRRPRHWQPDYRTVVPQTLHGYGRKARRVAAWAAGQGLVKRG